MLADVSFALERVELIRKTASTAKLASVLLCTPNNPKECGLFP